MKLLKQPFGPGVTRLKITGGPKAKMIATIRYIGKAIRQGSQYLPIRNHAAALATLAPPKDYLGQVKQIYDDAVKRWRYVNDPFGAELLTYGPQALANYVLALDNKGVGNGLGAGDCDCITAAVGSELMAIGRPVRIAVTAPKNAPAGDNFSHVFAQAHVPGHNWVTVDPVLFPKQEFGAKHQHSRIAYFNLSGKLQSYAGNVTW